MNSIKGVNDAVQQGKGFFPNTRFVYDPTNNTYRCPADHALRRYQNRPDKNAVRYAADPGDCACCPLRSQCTKAPFRTVTRHIRQETLERMMDQANSEASKMDLRRRKHFMERCFAVAARHGLKRCRWRRLWRAEIHDLLVATVQNALIIIRNRIRTGRVAVAAVYRQLFATRPTAPLSTPIGSHTVVLC
jgi:hypothetical protein